MKDVERAVRPRTRVASGSDFRGEDTPRLCHDSFTGARMLQPGHALRRKCNGHGDSIGVKSRPSGGNSISENRGAADNASPLRNARKLDWNFFFPAGISIAFSVECARVRGYIYGKLKFSSAATAAAVAERMGLRMVAQPEQSTGWILSWRHSLRSLPELFSIPSFLVVQRCRVQSRTKVCFYARGV